MNVPEQVPSDEWAVLEHMGKEIAEACFKSEGDAPTFVFRVPQARFLDCDITEQLTLEDLLKAAAISNDEVESWQFQDESHACLDGTNPELTRILPSPLPGATHLAVYVRLKSPAQAAARSESTEQEVPPEKWQALEALWKGILGLEAAIDALRQSLGGLRTEMEAAFKKQLHVDEKVHALQVDVVQWNKAKTRVHFALPRVREFIHRATWATAVPERKRLEELVKYHIEPRIPLADMDHLRERLEHLQKDRQVLFTQGNAVSQECRGHYAEIQRALSTLQRNAADRARKEREARREKPKYL